MNLKPLGANKTEVTLEKDGATYQILFSYQTPVAYIKTWPDGGMIVRKTSKKWSKTTSKHINSWIPTNHLAVDQSEFDNLLNGGKMDLLLYEKALNTVKTIVTMAAFINGFVLVTIAYRLFKKQSLEVK